MIAAFNRWLNRRIDVRIACALRDVNAPSGLVDAAQPSQYAKPTSTPGAMGWHVIDGGIGNRPGHPL